VRGLAFASDDNKKNYSFGGVVSDTLPVLCKENAEPILRQRVRLSIHPATPKQHRVQEAISGIAKAREYFAARNPKGDAQRGVLCGLLGFGLRDLSWDRVEREHSSSCVSETDQPTDRNTRWSDLFDDNNSPNGPPNKHNRSRYGKMFSSFASRYCIMLDQNALIMPQKLVTIA
jgi:hypothetical protein